MTDEEGFVRSPGLMIDSSVDVIEYVKSSERHYEQVVHPNVVFYRTTTDNRVIGFRIEGAKSLADTSTAVQSDQPLSDVRSTE